jgi:hypothetical protein
MSNQTRKRLIELPEKAWAALDADARRSRRSSMKQLQVLIENVYGLQDTELPGTEYVRRGPGRPSSNQNRPVEADKGYLMSTGGGANSGTEASGTQQDDLQDVQKDVRDRANRKKQTPGS